MFTYKYEQPSGYHFSLDSIQFAKCIAERIVSQANLSSKKILDLCAGCGVIGLELSWHLGALRHFDFVEVQSIYEAYFQKNIATINRPELTLQWHNINYDELTQPHWKEKFDLIISNPPYFQPHQGVLSPSEFKNRCRFFLDSTFEKFIHAIQNTLTINGEAYFLARSLKQHGCDLFEKTIKLLQGTGVTAEKLPAIRGTDVIFLKK